MKTALATTIASGAMLATVGLAAPVFAQTNQNNSYNNGNGQQQTYRNWNNTYRNGTYNSNHNGYNSNGAYGNSNYNDGMYGHYGNGNAGGSNYGTGNNNSRWQSRNSQHKTSGTFTGTVQSIRTVTFGNGKKYVLAKITDNQGHTAVLDLGTVNQLRGQNVQLRQGTKIQAQGRSGRLNSDPILVVYTFRVHNQNNQNNQGGFGSTR